MIKLSTIMPIYNKEKALRETLQSVVDNHEINDDEYECILIDDESTDSCPEICKEFCECYSYFKYFRIFNDGNNRPSNARNIGMNICKGEYVHFFDADDLLVKGFYKSSIEILDISKTDAIVRSYIVKDNNTYNTFMATGFKNMIYGPTVWSCIFRSNVAKKYKFKYVVAEDVIYTCEFLLDNVWYDDTENFNSIIYCIDNCELSISQKNEFNRPWPNNVVAIMQENSKYKYKLDGENIVCKFDETKIMN